MPRVGRDRLKLPEDLCRHLQRALNVDLDVRELLEGLTLDL